MVKGVDFKILIYLDVFSILEYLQRAFECCLSVCLYLCMYRHVLGVCVTNKTGFGFDDRIYRTFVYFLQHFKNHYLRLDTLDFWPHYTNPLLSLSLSNWTTGVGVTHCYTASGRTPQKAPPLTSNGSLLLSHIVVCITQ
jgi:hypothetical protein